MHKKKKNFMYSILNYHFKPLNRKSVARCSYNNYFNVNLEMLELYLKEINFESKTSIDTKGIHLI